MISYTKLPNDAKRLIFSFLIPNWKEREYIITEYEGGPGGPGGPIGPGRIDFESIVNKIMLKHHHMTYYDLHEYMDITQQCIKKVIDYHSYMLSGPKSYMYGNLHHFEPKMYYDSLIENSFESIEQYNNVVCALTYIMNIKVDDGELWDPLRSMIIRTSILLKLPFESKKRELEVVHHDTLMLLLRDYFL